MSTTKLITSLADLTKLTKASLSGGLESQEFFYKADEVETLVAHLLSAQWIAVSERLPESKVPVLVCEHRNDCEITIAEYRPDEVDTDDPCKWEYEYGFWSFPSFWMPLPAQPLAQQDALCAQLRAEQEGSQDA